MNKWFMRFAPQAYRKTRVETTKRVEQSLKLTRNLKDVSPDMLKANPDVLPILRMSTAPPIARDRLIGLSGAAANLVRSMELQNRIPPKMEDKAAAHDLSKIGKLIIRLVDVDIFPWLEKEAKPRQSDIHRAATIVADRLCGAVSDPIIRNAQEQRQLQTIQKWLKRRRYRLIKPGNVGDFRTMKPATFTFHLNVLVQLQGGAKQVNIPADVVIMPRKLPKSRLPLLIECKSAGDFTNPNKRRKEEAVKIGQLRATYGDEISYILFLCGYFDSGYLGYEAAEGLDWVWEHRIDDIEEFQL